MDACGRQSKLAGSLNGRAPPVSISAAWHRWRSRANSESFPELDRLPEWLARGYAGEMRYLHDPRRADPRQVLEGARSLIVVALNYNSRRTSAAVARQHDLIRNRRAAGFRATPGATTITTCSSRNLQALIAEMRAQFSEPFAARAYVDTGPIIERVAAKYAGLGWLGEKHLPDQFADSALGFFWASSSRRLTWRRLSRRAIRRPPISAARARAVSTPAPRTRSRSRTSSTRAAAFPISPSSCAARFRRSFARHMGSAVIGCDICQDVCPWNRKAPVTSIPAFQPRDNCSKRELARRTGTRMAGFALATGIQRRFSRQRRQAREMARTRSQRLRGAGKFRRHAGPLHRIRASFELLDRLASSEDSLISSEHARWALVRVSPERTLGAPIKSAGFKSKHIRKTQ